MSKWIREYLAEEHIRNPKTDYSDCIGELELKLSELMQQMHAAKTAEEKDLIEQKILDLLRT